MDKKTHLCTVKCPYFPDMELSEQDWIFDEKKNYKVRKNPKVFKCLYDGKPIDWNKQCDYVIKVGK